MADSAKPDHLHRDMPAIYFAIGLGIAFDSSCVGLCWAAQPEQSNIPASC